MMDNLEAFDTTSGLQIDESILSASNDSAFNEKFLLEDLDSYWDDLNARLIVSRMVGDSVIKGIVNAIKEEAAEKNSSMEAEIGILSERLQTYESGASKANKLGQSVVQEPQKKTMFGLQSNTEYDTHLSRLITAAEDHLQRLKNGIDGIRNTGSLRLTNLGSGDIGSCRILHQEKALDRLNQMDGNIDSLKLILAAVYEEVVCVVSSLKDSLYEKQWKWEFEKEIDSMIVNNFIKGLWEECESVLCQQKNILNNQNKRWLKKVDELLKLRQELDSVSKSLLSSEPGYLLFHGSHETFEELNTAKQEDHVSCKVWGNHLSTGTSSSEEHGVILTGRTEKTMLVVADSPPLLHMTKEDLINYYKTKIIKMKRQQESALHEKTEELFMLKREFLREKGSSHFKKDKEFEVLRKKIQEIVIKLDGILIESEMFPKVQDDHNKLYSSKDGMDRYLLENQHPYDLLTNVKKVVKCLSSRVSAVGDQTLNHSSAELSLSREIKSLEYHVEDMNIEAFIRNEVNKFVLRESIGEVKCHVENLEMESKMFQEFYCIILRELVRNVNCVTIEPIMMEYDKEKKLLDAVLLEKEKALNLEIDKTEKLKRDIASLSTLIEEKENALDLEVEKTERLNLDNASLLKTIEQKNNFAAEAAFALKKQKEQCEIVSQEVDLLRDRASNQEILIFEKWKESNLLKGKLDEASEQISQYKAELNETNQKLCAASNQLKEVEEQKAMLHDIIQQKQGEMASAASRENEQRKQMESIIISIQVLSKAFAEIESKMTESIKRNKSRLEILGYQCSQLIKQADFLRKKELWYKQRLEIRSSDLQKAEIEVDLLGDEVDALLSLSEKIYVALDHYSPVLHHYPGVMETLKLIKRELNGNS